MILLREAHKEDVEGLMHLAGIPGLYSLPSDRELLLEKIQQSEKSFHQKIKNVWEGKYLFVAEDLETGKLLGTSFLGARHGSQLSPRFYFKIEQEKKFSKTLQTGFIHSMLQLCYETDGPSEIGGLVVDPQYRLLQVGRKIAFVRFLFYGIFAHLFKEDLVAELLPPLNKRGKSPLWEAIGRRFTNMDYWEADCLSRVNKEFIFSLFPKEKIYTTFLSAEARNAIGKVGEHTKPVWHMLKKIGFRYFHEIDPFDGGPHLRAKRSDLLPIQNLRVVRYESALRKEMDPEKDQIKVQGLLACKTSLRGSFRAMEVPVFLKDQRLCVCTQQVEQENVILRQLQIQDQQQVVWMPYYSYPDERKGS